MSASTYEFREKRVAGIYRRVDNQRCIAGHARLFGLCVYRYNQMNPEWALDRVWSLGLVAFHHVGEGKSTLPAGWHVRFAKLKFKREYRGFSVRWNLADIFQ